MPSDIAGSVVVITGGASGIGRATARCFAAHGARVVIGDLDRPASALLAEEIGGYAVECDVRSEAAIEILVDTAVARFGRIDTMINNAGAIGARGSIAQIGGEAWRDTLALLFDSVFFGMKYAARHMIPNGAGTILTTASNASIAALGPHPYAACKAAVLGLTRSVASELVRHAITVNAVAPGLVATGMTGKLYGGSEATRSRSADVSPLGYSIEADEIAAMFLHLAGPAGRSITGQTIVIDGGNTTVRGTSPHH